jgi:hypothetical protein
MSSLVVLCLFSHYRIILLPHYELVSPPTSVGVIAYLLLFVSKPAMELIGFSSFVQGK